MSDETKCVLAVIISLASLVLMAMIWNLVIDYQAIQHGYTRAVLAGSSSVQWVLPKEAAHE